jgi:hypothetical protein
LKHWSFELLGAWIALLLTDVYIAPKNTSNFLHALSCAKKFKIPYLFTYVYRLGWEVRELLIVKLNAQLSNFNSAR